MLTDNVGAFGLLEMKLVVTSWFLHDDFARRVKDAWEPGAGWDENVKNFNEQVKTWSHNVFDHLGKQKNRILSKSDGIEKNYGPLGYTLSIEKLQRNLWLELEDILIKEDILWALKAKSNWFSLRDKNTKYFHAQANGRRRRNRIKALKNQLGNWVDDTDQIKSLATEFFSDLFKNNSQKAETHLSHCQFAPLDSTCLQDPQRDISNEEIKGAIFSMGPLKSPQPDGLNPLFFQNQWDTIRQSVINTVRTAFQDPSSIRQLNHTFIILILKREYPKTICDF
ncbi:uncharacterized protein LOC114746888 [Neltuma alba]|uniref:uncharacterized protein LOC114746888 n=1 Tax=Neltuma alba TaxID=207710 RepID=UPI0010A52D57|nr:uncharacterized protein LOC114746888 [Prosopis alba]